MPRKSIVSQNKNFVDLVNRLIVEKHYDGIPLLLQDKKNCKLLENIHSDVINICTKFLTDECYENNKSLYLCCEILLKSVAEYGNHEGVLFELLELAETTRSDNVFTTVLKCLQICLLHRRQNTTRSLEWSLNCLQNYISDLPIPDLLRSEIDEKQMELLEEDDEVRRILKSYVTVTLFYEPILADIIQKKISTIFFDIRFTERNLTLCFLLQLLNKPLALLNISNVKCGKNYSYAFQCANKIVKDICVLYPDPFYLLGFIEKRLKMNSKHTKDGTYESRNNIFLNKEKFSHVSLGICFYLLFNEGLLPNNSPKVYHPLYIFESCLYLAVELLQCKEPLFHYKAILLITEVLNKMEYNSITSNSLNLRIHAEFCNNLINVITYSSMEKNRIRGIQLIKMYILKFDDDGRYFLLKNLMKIITHNNLFGYIATIYKDVVAEKLENDSTEMYKYYKGIEFKNIMLNFICNLENNVETDLMQCSDKIMSSLNIIRYLAMKDKKNKTGFWDFKNEIKTIFLEPLRRAIDLSRAHYKAEEFKVLNDKYDTYEFKDLLKALSTEIPNLTKERKLSLLASAITTLDLIESLLARVNECIDSNKLT